jgi:hypothetical protein
MKLLTGMLAATHLLAAAGTSHAAVRIAHDQGGQIGRYLERYDQLRASGQHRRSLRLVLHNCPRRDSARAHLCNSKG